MSPFIPGERGMPLYPPSPRGTNKAVWLLCFVWMGKLRHKLPGEDETTHSLTTSLPWFGFSLHLENDNRESAECRSSEEGQPQMADIRAKLGSFLSQFPDDGK